MHLKDRVFLGIACTSLLVLGVVFYGESQPLPGGPTGGGGGGAVGSYSFDAPLIQTGTNISIDPKSSPFTNDLTTETVHLTFTNTLNINPDTGGILMGQSALGFWGLTSPEAIVQYYDKALGEWWGGGVYHEIVDSGAAGVRGVVDIFVNLQSNADPYAYNTIKVTGTDGVLHEADMRVQTSVGSLIHLKRDVTTFFKASTTNQVLLLDNGSSGIPLIEAKTNGVIVFGVDGSGNTTVGHNLTITNGTRLLNQTASRALALDANKDITNVFASAALSASLSDETGSASGGLAVFNNAPTLTGNTTAGFITMASGGIQTRSGSFGYFSATDFNLLAGVPLSWTGGAIVNSETGPIVQLGNDAATATAQTLKAHDGLGTDKDGGSLILATGNGTGTGGNAALRLRRTPRGTTGSSQNTSIDAYIAAPEKTLTDAATSLFEIALPTLKGAGGTIEWTIIASDATDAQVYAGITVYSAVNKGGVYTKNVSTTAADTESKSVSAGTLTAVFSLLDGTNKLTMQVTPTGSLTETTYLIFYTLKNNSPQAITLL